MIFILRILSADVAPYLIFWNLWIAYFFHLSAIAANITVLLSLSFAMSCAPFQIISSNINALFTLVCTSPSFRRAKHLTLNIERFSFECRKAIGFAFCTPHDWLKKLAPRFHPIRSKTKTNPDSLARVFPRFASASCNYFEF